MKNKVCLITGATSGIGKAAALALGRMGANLVLVGRNEARGNRVVSTIQCAAQAGSVEFVPTDLSAQSKVRALAALVRQRYGKIDVLLNNAGARFDSYGKTVDGLERTFATNHLDHFLLTCLLLDCLIGAPAARVITVASGSHSSANSDGDWQSVEQNYDRRMAYANSKLANILFAFELARRLKSTRVTSNAADPGGVASNFARNNGLLSWLRHLVAHGLRRELALPRRGAATILYLATSGEVDGISGQYFYRKQAVAPAPVAESLAAARQLWISSLQLTGLSDQGGPSWSFIRPD